MSQLLCFCTSSLLMGLGKVVQVLGSLAPTWDIILEVLPFGD